MATTSFDKRVARKMQRYLMRRNAANVKAGAANWSAMDHTTSGSYQACVFKALRRGNHPQQERRTRDVANLKQSVNPRDAQLIDKTREKRGKGKRTGRLIVYSGVVKILQNTVLTWDEKMEPSVGWVFWIWIVWWRPLRGQREDVGSYDTCRSRRSVDE